jgi:3-oxoacyl-[acyl-carrier protein] reductase
VAEITKEIGPIEILVNNAGITKDTLIMRMKAEDWDNVIHVNLTGLAWLSKAVIRGMMKKRFGRIINISSVVARLGNAGQANYAASKAGIEGFSRSLASEVASRGITVNSVAPGFIQTDMTDQVSEQQQAFMKQMIPVGRYGQVEEISSVVGFLAGDSASYITGATIPVNGGMQMN